MPVVGLVMGLASLGLSGYFLVKARSLTPSSEFGGVFEAGVAELFGLFAVGAVLASVVALILRRKWPLLSDGVSAVGVICGVVPAGLVIAFIGLQQFG
jgi:hypothetical protein